eukprot:1351230-Amorphochlora_amoeboformis.AAC.1
MLMLRAKSSPTEVETKGIWSMLNDQDIDSELSSHPSSFQLLAPLPSTPDHVAGYRALYSALQHANGGIVSGQSILLPLFPGEGCTGGICKGL